MSERVGGRRSTRGLSTIPREEKSLNRREKNQRPQKKMSKIRERIFTLGYGLDMPLLILVLVLLAIGLVMLFSASYAYSFYYYGDSFYFIRRQGGFAIFGIIAMLAISTFNYRNFYKLAKPLFFGSVVLLVLVVALKDTSFAPLKGGDANRWLNIFGFEFQPSEIAKFTLVVILAKIIADAGDKVKTFRYGVLPCGICLGLIAGLVVAEKHISATIIIVLISAIVMFVGGIKPRWFVGIGILGGVVLIYLVFFSSGFAYAMTRVQGWIDPFNPPDGVDTWQTVQSLYAIGSGQLLGVGLGQSRQKHLYLPEPQNDFIFAIVCEELGFIGALVILILFSMLIWRGVIISLNAKDKFGTLVGIGTTFTVGIQAVLNICVVTNAIPNTGISLPFFSYGGTALLILLGEMGVLLSISRSSYLEKT